MSERSRASTTSWQVSATRISRSGLEECRQALPIVADDRCSTCRGLEQAARGTPAHRGHIVAGDVQRDRDEHRTRDARRAADAARRRCCPSREILGILRAAENKAQIGTLYGGIDEEALSLCLPIGGVGADIGQVGAVLGRVRCGMMSIADRHARRAAPPSALRSETKLLERGAAGETQDEIKIAEASRTHIGRRLALAQALESNGRIEIVEDGQQRGASDARAPAAIPSDNMR